MRQLQNVVAKSGLHFQSRTIGFRHGLHSFHLVGEIYSSVTLPKRRYNPGADPGGGGCKGWQSLNNESWRPCTEGAGTPIFISIRQKSQPGANFCILVIWAPPRQQKRPSGIKNESFCPSRHPLKTASPGKTTLSGLSAPPQ